MLTGSTQGSNRLRSVMKVRHYSALVGLSIRQSAAMLSAPQGTPARKFLRPNRAAHCKLIQKYPYSISQLRSKPLCSQQLDASEPELISNAQRAFFRVFYNDVYEVPLPPRHRFPMKKYAQVRKEVQRRLAALPSADTDFVECEFVVSPLTTVEELSTTHSLDYIKRFLRGDQTEQEQRNVGFPWSLEGVDRALSSVGGTLDAARSVCDYILEQNPQVVTKSIATLSVAPDTGALQPWAAHVAGGTHHAFWDYGEGFSVFSDIAVAANVILEEYPKLVQKILILDLDVHQGNGNAVLFQGRPEVSTFSVHCQGNYFSEKEDSDLDIELPIGCTDATYLMTLNHWLKRIEEEGGPFDLVFYQAGVDIVDQDRLGRMEISAEGVQKRNEMVYEFVTRLEVPLVICMGGGYPKRADNWEPIIDAHSSVYFQAHQFLLQRAKKSAAKRKNV